MDTVLSSAIAQAIVELALAIVTLVLIPLLMQGLGSIRDQRIRDRAITLVRMAQQVIPDKSDRYSYAAGRLKQQFPALDEQRTREVIEAAVHAVKTAEVPAPTVVNVQPPVITAPPGFNGA